MQSVYIETSIVSYLTARPSRDVLAIARQQLTQQWWETCRSQYDLVVSALVEDVHRRNLWEALQMADEIMEDLWAVKNALAEEADYDVDKLVALVEARHRQRKEDAGRNRIDRPTQTPVARK